MGGHICAQKTGIVPPHTVPRYAAVTQMNCIIDEPLSGYPGGRPGTYYCSLLDGYVILQLINPIRIPDRMAERRRKSPKTSHRLCMHTSSPPPPLKFRVAASSRFFRMTNPPVESGKTHRLWRKTGNEYQSWSGQHNVPALLPWFLGYLIVRPCSIWGEGRSEDIPQLFLI